MATYLPLLKFDGNYAALAAREIDAGALPVDLRFGGQARYGCPTMWRCCPAPFPDPSADAG